MIPIKFVLSKSKDYCGDLLTESSRESIHQIILNSNVNEPYASRLSRNLTSYFYGVKPGDLNVEQYLEIGVGDGNEFQIYTTLIE